jgi:hypothetical protein
MKLTGGREKGSAKSGTSLSLSYTDLRAILPG